MGTGRPPKMTEEKIRLLKEVCRLWPTLKDAAAICDVKPSTIEKWIRKEHKESFSAFRDRHMVHTRLKLVRNLIKQADAGNVKATIYALERMGGEQWEPKVLMPGVPTDSNNGWTLAYAIPAKKESGE